MREELEADFQREYRVNLTETLARRLDSPTRLAGLAAHLPPGSAVWRALGGPQAWTDEVWMLAQVEYATRVVAWQKTKAAQSGRDKPEPLKPPASRTAAQVAAATAQRRAEKYLRRARRGQREEV